MQLWLWTWKNNWSPPTNLLISPTCSYDPREIPNKGFATHVLATYIDNTIQATWHIWATKTIGLYLLLVYQGKHKCQCGALLRSWLGSGGCKLRISFQVSLLRKIRYIDRVEWTSSFNRNPRTWQNNIIGDAIIQWLLWLGLLQGVIAGIHPFMSHKFMKR